jgi:hypothetical protein
MDYKSILFPLLSETNKKVICSIQYHVLRSCCHLPLKISHTLLLNTAKVENNETRVKKLNENYFKSCIQYENGLVIENCKRYLTWYPTTRESKFKTILCYYRDSFSLNLKI